MSEDFEFTPDEILAWEQHVRDEEDADFWSDTENVQRLIDEIVHGMDDKFFADMALVQRTIDDAHNEIVDAFWQDETAVTASLNDPI